MVVNKKILVTGGTGLIGRALIPELLNKGAHLRVQVRNARQTRAQFKGDFDFQKIEIVECDFTKLADVDSARLTESCDSVIHLAGLVHQPNASYQDYELLNVRATSALTEAAQRSGVDTFLLFSTSAVYGSGPFIMIDENAPIKSETPYAVSKNLCEQIVQNISGIKRVISFRPALVFGEGDRGNLIKLIQSINKGRYVQIGNGETAKSLIYAKDLARATVLCLEKLPTGRHTLNVANPEAVSMRELSKEILQILSKKKFIPSVPLSILKGVTALTDRLMPGVLPVNTEQLNKLTTTTTFSVKRLVEATGFQSEYSLVTALEREINWARSNGLL